MSGDNTGPTCAFFVSVPSRPVQYAKLTFAIGSLKSSLGVQSTTMVSRTRFALSSNESTMPCKSSPSASRPAGRLFVISLLKSTEFCSLTTLEAVPPSVRVPVPPKIRSGKPANSLPAFSAEPAVIDLPAIKLMVRRIRHKQRGAGIESVLMPSLKALPSGMKEADAAILAGPACLRYPGIPEDYKGDTKRRHYAWPTAQLRISMEGLVPGLFWLFEPQHHSFKELYSRKLRKQFV